MYLSRDDFTILKIIYGLFIMERSQRLVANV